MKKLKKVLSGALCALIAMLAPGIGAYQAAALDVNAGGEAISAAWAPFPLASPKMTESIATGIDQMFGEEFKTSPEALSALASGLPADFPNRVDDWKQTNNAVKLSLIKEDIRKARQKNIPEIHGAVQKRAKEIAQSLVDGRISADDIGKAVAELKNYEFYGADIPKIVESVENMALKARRDETMDAAKEIARSLLNERRADLVGVEDGHGGEWLTYRMKMAPEGSPSKELQALLKKYYADNPTFLSKSIAPASNGSKAETVPAPPQNDGSFMDRIRQISGVETTDLTGPRIMTIGINADYPVATIEAEVRAKVPDLSSVFVKIVYVDAANPGKILAADDLSSTAAPSGAKKTVSANVQNSSFRKIADSAAFGMLVIAASQLSLLPAIGVILGSGISWAMTPKGQPVFFRMLFGAAIGLGIAAMFAPAVAHAAIFGAAGLGVMKVVSQSPGLNNSSDGGASLPSSIPSDAQKAAAAQLSIGGLIFGLNDGYLEQGSKDGYPAKFTPSAVELLHQMNSAPPPAGDQLAAVSLEVSNKFLLRFAKIVDQINDRTGGNKAEFIKALHDVLLDPLTKQVVLKEGGFKTYQEALDAINSVLSQAEAGGTVAAGAYVGLSPEKGAAKIRELKLTQIRVVPLYGLIKVSMTVPVTEDLLQQVLQGVFKVAYKGDAPNFIWLEGPRK